MHVRGVGILLPVTAILSSQHQTDANFFSEHDVDATIFGEQIMLCSFDGDICCEHSVHVPEQQLDAHTSLSFYPILFFSDQKNQTPIITMITKDKTDTVFLQSSTSILFGIFLKIFFIFMLLFCLLYSYNM